MTISTLTAITAIAIFVSVLPGHAAACSDEIDLMQSQLDTKAAAIMDATRFAREARSALGLPKGTGDSLVVAGTRDSDASWFEEATAALARAREADRTSDVVACEEALAKVRRAIGL